MTKAKMATTTYGADGLCGGSKKKHTVWRIFWGLFFLVAAVSVVLSMADVLTFGVNIGWILLSLFLSAITIRSIFSLNWFGVFMPLGGIFTIVATQTNYFALDQLSVGYGAIGYAWAVAVLLAIGFSILFRKSYRGKFIDGDTKVIDEKDDSNVSVDVNFGATVKYVNSENFKRATLRCTFGSITAYFQNAKIAKGGKAMIEVDGSFCGMELYVPKTWRIVNGVNVNLAGTDEKNRPELTDASPTVELVGTLNLSGIEVIYV